MIAKILLGLCISTGIANPVVLRRIVNTDTIMQLDFMGMNNKYVDYCFTVFPNSAIVLTVPIPFCDKVPREFNGDNGYYVRINQAERYLTLGYGKATYYICEAILPDPEELKDCRGVWAQKGNKLYLLHRTTNINPHAHFEVVLSERHRIHLKYYHYN